jgi:putative FmdB family regulatory protein
MPRYCYRCKECEEELVVVHMMNEKKEDCSSCGATACLTKIPSLSSKLIRRKNEKTGEIVKQYIKDAKEEVRLEKGRLKNRGTE